MTALIGLVLLAQPVLPAAPVEPVPALEDPKPIVMHRWTGAVSLGVSLSDGNADRRTANASANGVYRREIDRTTLQFLWNYADEDGSVEERRVYGMAKYDYFLDGEKTYAYGQTSGEYNAAAALDLRFILGGGLGYQFQETAKWKLAGEGGLSYIDENYVGGDSDEEYVAARLAYNWEYKPDDKWVIAQTGELFPSLEDKDDVYAKVDTKARVTLTEKMFAQAEWIYSWDNTPATGAERVDNLYLFSLGWSF